MCRTSKWRPIENWCACIRNSRIQPPAIKTRSRPWLWCSSPNSPRSKPLPAYLRLSRCSKPSQASTRVIAYGGMDIEIKESGLWKGKAKLSKHGSGLLRRVLYMSALRCIHRKESAFGAYYQRLVQRGLKKGSALMAVMRKMLAVAAHLLMHEDEEDDRSLDFGSAAG